MTPISRKHTVLGTIAGTLFCIGAVLLFDFSYNRWVNPYPGFYRRAIWEDVVLPLVLAAPFFYFLMSKILLLDATRKQDLLARQQILRESEARWRSMTQLSADLYWEMDSDFRFTKFDGNGAHPDYMRAHMLGHSPWDHPDLRTMSAELQAYKALFEAHQTFRDYETQSLSETGAWRWMAVSGEPVYDGEGRFAGYRGLTRDITEKKNAEEEIRRLAYYDELTGLPNRRLLFDRIERIQIASARDGSHGTLMFFDLDNFKNINDSLGHEWGDRLLIRVAERLRASLRANDSTTRLADEVARLGGDEFVVVLGGLAGDISAVITKTEIVAHKLLAALDQPYDLDGQVVHCTSSIGVTLFQGHDQTVQELLQYADLAMYQAKAQGRNTMHFFDAAMQAEAAARLVLETEMRAGLQRGEFLPYYQPIVDADGQVLGAEALVRWQHPQRGLVLPGEFISMAEQTGLILALGKQMLHAACQQLVQWAGQPATEWWTISVNVSAYQFKQTDFVVQVLNALSESGANPERLKLELTESILIRDVMGCIAKIQALQECGVRFSLDDFGIGYSSLGYLKRLPLDQLKIDQSFVQNILIDSNDATIVNSIVTLAQSLGLDVVAEGVETEAQREFLLHCGCRKFQGYLFGRPGPVEVTIASSAGSRP